jgi:uncharacterized protein YbbC (DUF1343 family)/CubicO group peptidase (beta-lactamase class C family)
MPIVTALIVLLTATAAWAQEFRAADAVIRDAIAREEIPGAVLLVGHKGKTIHRKAYGMRSLEPVREAMTPDTIFDIASLTKPITATCVMELVRVGKIRLSDPFAKYVPELGANGKDQITIRQLLTHYSGLRPDLDLDHSWSGRETAYQLIAAEKPVSPAGAEFIYSDINYEILDFLIEKVSGKPLPEFAQEVVFAPLAMKDTRFTPPPEWSSRIAPTEYDEHGSMMRGVVHDPTTRRMGGVAGHAGVFSTADDLARFAQAMLNRKGLLTPALIEKMSTPQQPPWATTLRGLGWDIDSPFSTNRGELVPVGSFGHTGFTGTSMWIDPYTQTYVILLANAVHPRNAGDPWPKVSLRTKVANAVASALDVSLNHEQQARVLALTGYNEAAAAAHRPVSRNGVVLSGIDVLAAEGFARLRGKRIGLLTNQTGRDRNGNRTIDLLAKAPGVRLAAIFSPEHGVTGTLDTAAIGHTTDAATRVRVYSLYGSTDASRRPTPEMLRGLDVIVLDFQDVGARFYTYIATMLYVMEAAAGTPIEVVVLDRPNPISGTLVQGAVSDTPAAFINPHPMPARHGMTVGEIARMFAGERKLATKLTVVPLQGWQRGDWFDSTGQVWVNPSPNMRSLTQATLYPGVAQIEYSNLSVGRGTDTPFEIAGASWISAAGARELAEYLNGRRIAGARFVPITFTPTSSVDAGKLCGGVNIIITDRFQLDSPQLGMELASGFTKLFPNNFKLEPSAPLIASRAVMEALKAGHDPRRIAEQWEDGLAEFKKIRQKYLLYP